jgi:bifunctional DNA primase/polymerase-like protein
VDEPLGLAVARIVASWGFRVFPGFVTRTGEKIPYSGFGGNWVKLATTEEREFEQWWEKSPWLWPGTVSGVGSSLVLDIDSPGALDWFRSLVGRNVAGGWGSCTGGWCYRTPGKGGGMHLLYRWPAFLGNDFRQAKVCLPEGGEVQIRGEGHWTLLCGAPRPDGKYETIEEPPPSGPVVAPEGLVRAVLAESVLSVGRPLRSDGELREVSPEAAWAGRPWMDGRKNTLAGLCWYMAMRSESEVVVETAIRFGAECCVPPLGAEFCRRKAEYALERARRYKERSEAETQKLLDSWSRWA